MRHTFPGHRPNPCLATGLQHILAEKRINNTFKYNHEPLLRVYCLCNDSRSTRTKTGILGRQQYMQ